MTDDIQLREVLSSLEFTRLLQCFQMAVGPTKLVLGFLAVSAIFFVGWTMDLCTTTVAANPDAQAISGAVVSTGEVFADATELDVYIAAPGRLPAYIDKYILDGGKGSQGVFSTLWDFASARFNFAVVSLLRLDVLNVSASAWLCVKALCWAVKFHIAYSFIFFVFSGAIICFTGGAVCRCAALEYASGDKLGIRQALRFSAGKAGGLVVAPLILVGMMLALAVMVYLLGLVGNIPWIGELLISAGLGAALLLGALITLILVGLVAGIGLIFPAIAYEGSDGFDAISRSFTYVFSEPWWMVFYNLVAAGLGTVSYLIIRFFVFMVLIVTYSLLDLGILSDPGGGGKLARIWARPEFLNLLASAHGPANFTEGISSFFIHLTVLVVIGMLTAFVISFYFCANTIIYSLVRKKADGVAVGDVYSMLDEICPRPVGAEQDAG